MAKIALLENKLERCEVHGINGQCKTKTSHRYEGLVMCSNCFYHIIMRDALYEERKMQLKEIEA